MDCENSVEIVAVDIDFTSFGDFYFLFDPNSNLIEDICYDAVSRVYEPENSNLLGAFNAYWGGYAPPPNAIDEFINTANGFVVQASANVTQNGIS